MNEKMKLTKGLLGEAEANEQRAAAQTGGDATEDTKAVHADYLVEQEGMDTEGQIAGAAEEAAKKERSEAIKDKYVARMRQMLLEKDPEGVPDPREDRYHNLDKD